MKLNFEWFCHWKLIKLQKIFLERKISWVIINSHLTSNITLVLNKISVCLFVCLFAHDNVITSQTMGALPFLVLFKKYLQGTLHV